MKIGFYSESVADQAALAVFTEGILGEPPEPIDMALEGHGLTSVLSLLANVFRGVYYNSDAQGLVVVVDCDDTELHSPDHDKPDCEGKRCRLCQARAIVAGAEKNLKRRQGRTELKVAFGLAVPAIEAWYLVGKNHQVGEAAWIVGLNAKNLPFRRRELKQLVYGTDRPSIELETDRAKEEARRILDNITAIEMAFPAGFGSMAREIRSWKFK